MFFKKKREENRKLLEDVKRLPCAVCNRCQPTGNDPDHVTSRGAGGGDTVENVMPLCREHHTERHAVGKLEMCRRYEGYRRWLMMFERYDVLDRLDLTCSHEHTAKVHVYGGYGAKCLQCGITSGPVRGI